MAAAEFLGTGDDLSAAVRSIDDRPEVAHAFHWAIAAELLAARRTRIVAGPLARDLRRDPLAAWFRASITLLEHGLLGGFRQGWRKSYVELLDAGAGPILAAILEVGGATTLTSIEDLAWEQVAQIYGYDVDDDAERRHTVRLVTAMVARFADLGVVTRRRGDIVPDRARKRPCKRCCRHVERW